MQLTSFNHWLIPTPDKNLTCLQSPGFQRTLVASKGSISICLVLWSITHLCPKFWWMLVELICYSLSLKWGHSRGFGKYAASNERNVMPHMFNASFAVKVSYQRPCHIGRFIEMVCMYRIINSTFRCHEWTFINIQMYKQCIFQLCERRSRMMISVTINQESACDKYGYAWYMTECNPSFLTVMRVKLNLPGIGWLWYLHEINVFVIYYNKRNANSTHTHISTHKYHN